MKRKMISILILICIVAASVAGCSSTANTASQSTSSSTESSGAPGNSQPGSGSSATITETAAYSQSGSTATKSNEKITASDSNESGIKVSNSGTLTISDSEITTSGSTTSEDESNFYGLNAGVLAESGSTINLSDSTISTSGSGANGVFATGSGSTVNVSNVTIKTTADSSRGLDATQTGIVNATDVTISTAGTHCAAIATDRGEGTINVTGGTMTTTGTDSPGIYSTGTITVSGAKITATASEAAVVEGKNSVTLTNTTISGAKKNGVMMYQSFSGDATTGTSTFTMTGGSLSAAVGSLFYITNTQAVVNLKGADLTASSGSLITAAADRWGTSSSNGGTLTFNADSETLAGDIVADKISSIDAVLKNNTTLTSSVNNENKLCNVSITLDSTSKWNVTTDSYVKSLTDSDTTLSNIISNGHTIYYDSSNSANSWLNGKTITLSGGGKLTPYK